jgi:hypothetical protein
MLFFVLAIPACHGCDPTAKGRVTQLCNGTNLDDDIAGFRERAAGMEFLIEVGADGRVRSTGDVSSPNGKVIAGSTVFGHARVSCDVDYRDGKVTGKHVQESD